MKLLPLLAPFVILLVVSAADAATISGESTAALETTGPYAGWYRYDFTVTWDLEAGAGLSHWDLLMKMGCAEPDHLYASDDPAGYSNSEEEPENMTAVSWTMSFLPGGDPTTGSTGPAIKYEHADNPSANPGPQGTGNFWFYSNVIPEFGTFENALVGKSGSGTVTFGTLTGDWPSCSIPEPGTMILIAVGVLPILSGLKRSRR